MLIDFNQKIKTIKGKVIKNRETKEDVTLKDVASIALFSEDPRERVDGKEKRERYRLAQKIEKGGKIDLCKHEVKKLRDMIGATMSTLFSGQAWDMLDEAEDKDKNTHKKKRD